MFSFVGVPGGVAVSAGAVVWWGKVEGCGFFVA